MRARLSLLTAAALAVACAEPRNAGTPPADTVFLGGAVYTVDSQRSRARAVAIRDGRIARVGRDADVRPCIGAHTRVVELEGRMLLPGFHDAHIHPVDAGLDLLECPLSDLGSVETLLAAVRRCAASRARRGDWLVGSGWDVSLFPDGDAPKALLDAIVPDEPVALVDANGHAVWVNSEALARAGVGRETPDPPAGVIERDPRTGEPSGTLRETAAELVYAQIPPVDEARWVEAARLAIRTLHGVGVTSVVDADVGEAELRAYRALADAGELDLRVVACIGYPGDGAQGEALLARREDYRRPRLDPDCVKLYVDGVLEGETAALLEAYVGRPGYFGEPNFRTERLRELVVRFDAQGLRVHLHAIGDAAVRSALDALQAARETNGPGERHHTIAHLQLVHPDDIPRFAELGVFANFQAIWAYPDDYVTKLNLPVIGEERLRRMYPIGSVHRAGGRLVLGTDWDVTPPDPLPGIEVGILRRDPAGAVEGALNPEEGVDLATLIEAYTLGGARVMGQEHETGSIEPGKAADLVLLERDLFALPPERISEVRVLETLVDGRTVYAAP